MRDFFIKSLESIIGVALVVMAVSILAGAVIVMDSPRGGVGAGVIMLVTGGIGLLVVGGLAYLGIGIYHNTRRAAEALDALVKRQG